MYWINWWPCCNVMNRIILFTLCVVLSSVSMAQELKCQISVVSPQVQNTEKRIFETLQKDIREFMNARQWTGDVFSENERIECNFLINVTERISNDRYKATIQVQSSRPAHKSGYNTIMLNVQDNNVEFNYLENDPLVFQQNQHLNNLTSILAFYAYMVIGYDYESFGSRGGEQHFQSALQIVNTAQNAPDRGWKAFEGTTNRYWLVENTLNPRFQKFRDVIYKYHREGIDLMQADINRGREAVTLCVEDLKRLRRDQPNSYLLQTFFSAKSDELVNIYSQAFPDVKNRVAADLKEMDPGNALKYDAITRSN
jgi:hypothetical protein